MTACTGQPILANNITQAQAFCIATACLQVQVLNKRKGPLSQQVAGGGNSMIERTIQKWNHIKWLAWARLFNPRRRTQELMDNYEGPNYSQRLIYSNQNKFSLRRGETMPTDGGGGLLVAQHRL